MITHIGKSAPTYLYPLVDDRARPSVDHVRPEDGSLIGECARLDSIAASLRKGQYIESYFPKT